MKRLVSTLNLPKEDWLRYRKCGITGTDAGAILGLNPYRSAFMAIAEFPLQNKALIVRFGISKLNIRLLILCRKPTQELPSFGQNGASCIGF